MLNKLLFQNQNKKQFWIALIGAFLGMFFLVLSIHYTVKINEFGKGSDVLGPNTLMVQKKVTNSSTLNLTKTDFSGKEIQKMNDEYIDFWSRCVTESIFWLTPYIIIFIILGFIFN